jgi:hypothetical protein
MQTPAQTTVPTPTPAHASTTIASPPIGGALTHHVLGTPGETGRFAFAEGNGAERPAPLESEFELLPELAAEAPPRPIWRQPAFVVSVAAALVMVLGFIGVLVVQALLREPDRVEGLTITDTGSQYFLQWKGPDVPYSVIMTGGDAPADISAYIRDGRTLWIPTAAEQVKGDSCFVVRSMKAAADDPSTAAATARALRVLTDLHTSLPAARI